MAELMEDSPPALLATKYAAILRYYDPPSDMSRQAQSDLAHEQSVAKKLALACSIRDDGFDEKLGTIVVKSTEGRLVFVDGTHRACCLLVLGRPVIAELQEPLPTFEPLERYPLRTP
jgi:hypothetical protein